MAKSTKVGELAQRIAGTLLAILNEYTQRMKMTGFPLSTTDWAEVAATEHRGETGVALWRTQNFGEIRVRMVDYSPGYSADHWCSKGHILLCLEGELEHILAA